jgi:hypothetical protein
MPEPVSAAIGTLNSLSGVLRSIDGLLTDKDAIVYRSFLISLSDYQCLTSEYGEEFVGKVINAVERLRQLITKSSLDLPVDSKLIGVFFILGTLVREFLSAVDKIEHDIRTHVKSLKRTSAQYESDKKSLEYWEDWGYPETILQGNLGLSLYEIQPQMFQTRFVLALGELRGGFRLALGALCEATLIELPPPLAALTPGIEDLAQGSE